jgi:hypothetical protein
MIAPVALGIASLHARRIEWWKGVWAIVVGVLNSQIFALLGACVGALNAGRHLADSRIHGLHLSLTRMTLIQLASRRYVFDTSSGLHVLAPEIVLLYKSNSTEEYDADFRNAFASLSVESRVWLRAALDRLFARHPWAERLSEPPAVAGGYSLR